MPRDHVCPDCGRKFTSGAALGGHRRVHTKGRLSKQKGYKNQRNRRSSSNNSNNAHNTNNHNTIFPFRTSPEPTGEQKFYGEYITDISTEEDEDNDDYDGLNDNNEDYWNSAEFTAMPPPIKKRKLNDPINNGTVPSSIGYVVEPPTAFRKPTKMDAIREQIGLAMTLYHFNADKLADFCDVPKQIFIKWLQGGIQQQTDIGVNANNNSNIHGKHLIY